MNLLKSARLLRARELIVTTNPPVAQIARESDFLGRSNFSHAFRKMYGVDPTGFREAAFARSERTGEKPRDQNTATGKMKTKDMPTPASLSETGVCGSSASTSSRTVRMDSHARRQALAETLSKEKARVDMWLKDIGSSAEPRKRPARCYTRVRDVCGFPERLRLKMRLSSAKGPGPPRTRAARHAIYSRLTS
jgi:hypothetical protein